MSTGNEGGHQHVPPPVSDMPSPLRVSRNSTLTGVVDRRRVERQDRPPAPGGAVHDGGPGLHQDGPGVPVQGRHPQGPAVPFDDHHVHREGDPAGVVGPAEAADEDGLAPVGLDVDPGCRKSRRSARPDRGDRWARCTSPPVWAWHRDAGDEPVIRVEVVEAEELVAGLRGQALPLL